MAISECNTTTDIHGKELLQHGSESFPVACYHDDLNINSVPWHWHDEFETVVVEKGSMILNIESKNLKIETGDGFFINSGVLHSCEKFSGSSECRLLSIVFHANLLSENLYSVFREKYINPVLKGLRFLCLFKKESWQKEILDFIENAWDLCKNENYGYEFFMRENLSRIIIILNEHQPEKTSKISKLDLRSEERMKIMLKFIHDNFDKQINIKNIAESVSVSESECLRCFHKIINTTPGQYLKKYRLRTAAGLLISGDKNLKISDIALQCGFLEMSYFSKSFKEIYNITPGEYRNSKL